MSLCCVKTKNEGTCKPMSLTDIVLGTLDFIKDIVVLYRTI